MKHLSTLILAFALFTGATLFSQTVTTNPEFPTDIDNVVLTLDATGSPLENYNGDVFTHTGLLVVGNPDWENVIGDWGNNTNQPELTSLGNNKYELLITPSIREFYNAGGSEEIIKMAFVFRSADGNTQTSDMFVDVFSSNLSIIISEPGKDRVMAVEGAEIPVVATSPLADSMFLYVDGELKVSTDQISLSYTINALNTAGYWVDINVEIVAKNETETVTESFVYFVIPQPDIEDLPVGMVDGINYIDDNTVLLSLYAPEKDFVFVIGDFNEWQMVENFYMNKTTDGNRFWVQIENLEAGKEYIFQYLVEDEVRIGDPYADKVSDPWNDHYINNATYPSLIDYPTGMTSGIATVLQTAQEPYQWQVTNFTPPAVVDMVVYECLIRDFTAAHTYKSLADTIGYFKRLGVNVIELMPVSEFEGNLSWGYNPNYYFAPDKYYGPKDRLKEFIDVCHQNGIAVVLDMVLNHSFGTSPNVLLYWDSQTNRPAANNPWYNQDATHDFNVGYDFNHESPQTKEFVKRVNNYWLEEYKFDGFRFDLSKGFTQNYTVGNVGQWGQYDQSRIDIWNEYATAIRETNPDAYIILEHFADNSEEKVLSANGMMPWGNSVYNYNEGTMGYNENGKSDFSWISYQKRGWSEPHVVGYMESHDEERLMFKNIEYGNASGSYNTADTLTALKRMALAANFFFTIPGPKMIWQFGEMGYDYSINYPSMTEESRTAEKPAEWGYLDNGHRKYLFNVYSVLIDMKKNMDVFETTQFSLDVHNATKSIVLNQASMDMVVVGNFDVLSKTHTPAWPNTGTWYEYYSQSTLEVTGTNQSVSLQPGAYKLFTSEYVEISDNFFYFPPNIVSLAIDGYHVIDSVLTASYQYNDPAWIPEGNSQYQWYRALNGNFEDLEPIDGQTTLQYIATEEDATEGYYIYFGVVPVNHVGAAGEESVGLFGQISGVGIDEINKANINVYPNPSSGAFIFSVNSDLANNATIEIFDAVGKMVYDIEMNGSTGASWNGKGCDNERVVPGIYFARVISENYQETIKLVINK
nr:T9SS type A sorting domain-containing protein [Bacteroidota bacterium]